MSVWLTLIIVLDVLEEETIPETLNVVHPSLLDEMFFGRASFDVEDVIAALQPVYVGEDEHRLPDHPPNKDRLAIQKQALRKKGRSNKPNGAFVNVLRTLSRHDKDLLTSFVLYITGYDYLPATLMINIEFNSNQVPNALPVAHTCDCTLKLPGLAYNAKEDVIEKKLCMALKYFKHSTCAFNMK